jgi:hypothetical protein
MGAINSQLKDIEHIANYFHEVWKGGKPIFKLFLTDTTGYLYDTGTNKILGCDEFEYSFLKQLVEMDLAKSISNFLIEYGNAKFIETAGKIISAIEKDSVLLTKRATKFGRSSHFHNFEELTNTSLGMIQLETTERCNLRCD